MFSLVELWLSCPVLAFSMLVVYTYIIPLTSKTRFEKDAHSTYIPKYNGPPRLWSMYTLTNRTQAYGRIARNSLFSYCSQGRSSVLGTVPFCEWIPQETVLPALQAVRCVLTANFPSARSARISHPLWTPNAVCAQAQGFRVRHSMIGIRFDNEGHSE